MTRDGWPAAGADGAVVRPQTTLASDPGSGRLENHGGITVSKGPADTKGGEPSPGRLRLPENQFETFDGESTEYDEDLGRRMARDARRVSNGDLSEAAFHEKYHEEVKAEFGRDDRPVDNGDDS